MCGPSAAYHHSHPFRLEMFGSALEDLDAGCDLEVLKVYPQLKLYIYVGYRETHLAEESRSPTGRAVVSK